VDQFHRWRGVFRYKESAVRRVCELTVAAVDLLVVELIGQWEEIRVYFIVHKRLEREFLSAYKLIDGVGSGRSPLSIGEQQVAQG